MDQLFKDEAELFRWGPIPGHYFYAAGDVLDSFFIDLAKSKAVAWPATLFLFQEGRMIWLTDFTPMIQEGKQLFFQYIQPQKKRLALVKEWKSKVAALSQIESTLNAPHLKKLTNEELIKAGRDLHQALLAYWGPTLFPELGNYGAERYLEEEIRSRVKDTVETLQIMEIITAPEEPSFYQLEEIELFKTSDLSAHQRKYFWLKNNHYKTEVLPESYFAERKASFPPDLEKNVKAHFLANKKRKEEFCLTKRLPEALIDIGELIAQSIVWQDRRKMHTFISLHYKYLFLQEVARRLEIDEHNLLAFNLLEILHFLVERPSKALLQSRQLATGAYCSYGSVTSLSAQDTLTLWERYAEEKTNSPQTNQVQGMVVSKGSGTVRGRVQVLLDPAQPFQFGSILLTSMTSPEYVFPMKHCLAVVTDVGGIGSHAAIVSRELKKPCIVGTKFATKIFKDGDLVEVNVDSGVIRRLSSS